MLPELSLNGNNKWPEATGGFARDLPRAIAIAISNCCRPILNILTARMTQRKARGLSSMQSPLWGGKKIMMSIVSKLKFLLLMAIFLSKTHLIDFQMTSISSAWLGFCLAGLWGWQPINLKAMKLCSGIKWSDWGSDKSKKLCDCGGEWSSCRWIDFYYLITKIIFFNYIIRSEPRSSIIT